MLTAIIKRPILAIVISVIIVLLGFIGLQKLSITRFPEIAPPCVVVNVRYPGASAQTVAKGVLVPIEEAVNGVDKMTYITSKSSNDGSGTIYIYFESGTDPGQAAVDVQTRVSKASDQIPTEVIKAGVSVSPRQRGTVMTVNVFSEKDSIYDETFLQAYTRINVVRELRRVPGVAEINNIGSRDYSMRIWLNPERLAAYDLSPQEVIESIRSESFEIAPGKFGEASDEVFEIPITYSGRFIYPEQYEKIPIRKNIDGSLIFLKDLATVELGASNIGSDNRVNGFPGVTLNLTQTAKSNVRDIDAGVRKVMDDLSQSFPTGIKYDISYSVRNQIDQSISQLVHTLFEALILVFLVVFIFLQDIKITIIPIIAIPVSLIGTLFFVYLLGFSLNVLTMFALVLVIGIVVDNAIIVVEAIHERVKKKKEDSEKASIAVMKELTGALISITMVMSAVFIPVGFMEGPTGIFYQQFAYTLAIAIIISAVNAFTLTPALSRLFITNERHVSIIRRYQSSKSIKDVNKRIQGEKIEKIIRKFRLRRRFRVTHYLVKKFFRGFNLVFDKFIGYYERKIKVLLNKPIRAFLIFASTIIIGVYLMMVSPSSFIPTEDDSFLTFSLVMQPGASLARTKRALDKADSILSLREDIKGMTNISGYNTIDANASSSFAVGYLNLRPYKERGKIKKIDQVKESILQDLSVIDEATFQVFPRPTVDGFGNFSGVEFVVEDRYGSGFDELEDVTAELIKKLNKSEEVGNAFTTFNSQFPQYNIEVDYTKAKSMGVSAHKLMSTIQAYFGRVLAGDFNRFGRQYRVYVQAEAKNRIGPSSFSSVYVKNNEGEMVPVSTLVKLVPALGPETVRRQNLYNCIAVKASIADGFGSGDVMKKVEELAKELPSNYTFEFAGMSKDEQDSQGQAGFVFAISILLVYLLLAAQYESLLLPIAILLSIPSAFLGTFLFVKLAGLNNNIYVQVGLILLIGLLAKNSILIVEYAVQKRKEGYSIYDAAIEGAKERLRPILMTSFAFIFGLIPLMWTVGPSAMGNHSISFSTAGGMLSGVIIGIFFTPYLFYIFQRWDEKLQLFKRRTHHEEIQE